MLFEIVGKYEAVVKSLNIARRALEEQALEIEERDKTIRDLQKELAEFRAKKKLAKSKLSVVQLYRFPKLTPGL